MDNKGNLNIMWAIIICVVLVAGLIFFSFNNKNTNMTSNNENTNESTNNDVFPAKGDVFSGKGVAKAGDTVSMNYTGRLEDGTVFDSNVDPKFNHVVPFNFTLGAGQVIAGWDKGIVGMKVGDKKTLTIPPEDAYGKNGIPGVIPPNATLIFDVELTGIK